MSEFVHVNDRPVEWDVRFGQTRLLVLDDEASPLDHRWGVHLWVTENAPDYLIEGFDSREAAVNRAHEIKEVLFD